MIYSAEIIKPGTLGRNIAPYMSEVELIKGENIWLISSWKQIKGAADDLEYFRDVLGKIDNAKKRYGVEDLANWDGLKD